LTLRRELNLRDLVLLMVVAVVNVNTLPLIAIEGWRAVSYWILAFVLFLVPQGLAVAEFGKRFPGEGGIYVWTRECFGDFHAFISGWCYWTNNLFYLPSVIILFVGVLTYTGGPNSARLADNQQFIMICAIAVLWIVTLLHIRGLGVGKWLNNLGAFGVWISLSIMLIIGILAVSRTGSSATPFNWTAALPSFTQYSSLSAFSVAMYSLVGLELASVMGDEIQDPAKIIGRAVVIAGLISIFLYILGTISLIVAVNANDIGAITGVMQAATIVITRLNLQAIIPFVAVVLALAVLGVCSAWLAGSARIPFVMGVDVYLPKALGKLHPKWNTPMNALLVQGVVCTAFVIMSLSGSTVREGFEKLLKCSIVLQLIPFVYLFAGLYKIGVKRGLALIGCITSLFGIAFVFVPSSGIENFWAFELTILGGSVFMLGLACVLYWIARKKITAKAQTY
jgi:glutamate:GABA antiporter